MTTKIAHVTKIEDEVICQDLKEHLTHVAELCRGYMGQLGCPAMGYIIGITHDIGKAGAAFQKRMQALAAGQPDPGQKGGHASAGAVLLSRIGGNSDNRYQSFALQAMCEAIFSHHAALPDNVSPEGVDGYKARMQCDETELREIEEYLWEEIISRKELDKLLQQAYGEAESLYQKVVGTVESPKERCFYLGMAEKMLLSALIDADWLDSAVSGERVRPDFADLLKAETGSFRGDGNRRQLFAYFLNNLENRLKKMGPSSKPINIWRNYISDGCKEAGDRKGGIYTLSCPTGAGKTLAVTRFSLAHCIQQNRDRIFYIIPYLSVIDQTAKSLKAALARESVSTLDELVEDNILELHSQAESRKGKLGETPDEKTELSLDGDFWAQRMAEPVILTTMVRFLNTFFASGTRNLRPAHQFQNAVLIFDEVQTLPIKQIELFNSLINFLAYMCDCTCVLCTATQPILGEVEKPIVPARMAEQASLMELPEEASAVFKRVQIKAKLKKTGYTREELADFIWERAESGGNVLAILNTKDSALAVYSELQPKAGDAYKLFYLSTKLYAAHRKSIIEEIRKALAEGEKLIVVSTQLIEAGIDFDFSCVVRALAGLDSIVQAAGRCNREGLRGVETIYIVNPCEELESLAHLKDIQKGARASARLLEEFEKNPQSFDNELQSGKAVYRYFQYYFWNRKEEMSYPISKAATYSLYDLLADNSSLVKSAGKHKGYERKALNQSFRTAAEHFNVIEDEGNSVFVPRGRGREIWEELHKITKGKRAGYELRKRLLKEAQQYVVNLRKYELEKLGKGVIAWEDEMGMYVLNEMYYGEKTGITGEIDGDMPFYGF